MVNTSCSSSSSEENEPSTSTPNVDFEGPTKNRSCTDFPCLVIFLLVLISLFGLIFYCAVNADTRRVFYGYDQCGNICGFNNPKNSKFCTGRDDVHDKKYLKMEAPLYQALDVVNVTRKCVKACESKYQLFVHRCIPEKSTNTSSSKNYDINSFISVVFQNLLQTKSEIILLCIFSFILSHIILCMLRFLVGIVVWFILVGVIVTNFIVTILLWYHWHNLNNKIRGQKNDTEIYLVYAISSSISTIVITFLIVWMRKRFALVVQLFKEAGKAIEYMPILLIQPVLTFFVLCVVVVVWFYNALFIESSGYLSFEPNSTSVYYEKDLTMQLTRIFNIFVFIWIVKFIITCQHMVVAGAVAKWYFSRNKTNLASPLIPFYSYLIKYHLGSVALGSIIVHAFIALRYISHYIGKMCKKSDNTEIFQFFQYFSRNAYIEVSIYGDNLYKSGKRAYNVRATNKLRTSAINAIGDFVLIMIKVLVTISNIIVGYKILENKSEISLWVPLAAVGLFSYFVAHCFISVYEILIDALFICFCEDCHINYNPKTYFMSEKLLDFVLKNQKEENDCLT